MDPKSLLESLQKLQKVLNSIYELDWFHSLGKYVDYSKYESIELVKPRVDHVMGGLSVLYLFAIFETYFDNKYWEKYLNVNDIKLLRAYRHIRHSIAHGHDGSRLQPRSPRGKNQEEYDAFEEAIANNLFSPKNIIELDTTNNTITIHPATGIYLKPFMLNVAKNAIAEVAKYTGI